MSEAMCCALSGGDEQAEMSDHTVRTARRDYLCCECRGSIQKGTKYEDYRLLFDGSWSKYRTCLLCVEIRDHFACNDGWTFEFVWEQLEEYFFPDMKAGGPCMEGLSPAAKGRLFDRRMKWLEDSA